MQQEFRVVARDPHQLILNQLANPDFSDDMDWVPKRVFNDNNKREYKDFMSGNWAWREAVGAHLFIRGDG